MKAMAKESLRFYPPDKELLNSSVLLTKLTSLMVLLISSSIVSESAPLNTANNSKCSYTVRSSNSILC